MRRCANLNRIDVKFEEGQKTHTGVLYPILKALNFAGEMSRRRHSEENDGEFTRTLANWLTVSMEGVCLFTPVFRQGPPAIISLVKSFTQSSLIGGRDAVCAVSQSVFRGICLNTGGYKNCY